MNIQYTNSQRSCVFVNRITETDLPVVIMENQCQFKLINSIDRYFESGGDLNEYKFVMALLEGESSIRNIKDKSSENSSRKLSNSLSEETHLNKMSKVFYKDIESWRNDGVSSNQIAYYRDILMCDVLIKQKQ